MMDIRSKDVSLMAKDARFSNPLTTRDWYRINGIPEVRIIDIPEGVSDKSFEELTLEV